MRHRVVLSAIAVLILGISSSVSASGYFAVGASYRAFSSDASWSAADWQRDLKGSVFLTLAPFNGVRINMSSYIGYGGVEALPEEEVPAPPLVSLAAKAGIDYDLVKYEKDGTYFGFGPMVCMSYGNMPSSAIPGKVDFGIGAEAFLSALSGKLEMDGSIYYTFRDLFVGGGLMVRYNPVGPLVIFAGMEYLRRDGLVSLGVGLKF